MLIGFHPARPCFQRIAPENNLVLSLTPLFWVDYTRLVAHRATLPASHANHRSRGFGPPGSFQPRFIWAHKDMRGRLGQRMPPGSVERVNLQQRIDRWVSRGFAWMMRKLLAKALGTSGAGPVPQPEAGAQLHPVALQRDPYCGTYVSPEISFPWEQSGQVLHFCSAECRARYQSNSKRAASA